MRVLQIIDSLEPGGAETIAVNYANALSKKIEFSGIVVTRKEGILKEQLHKEVPYFFLNRKNIFDLKSILYFRKIILKNKINIIHAHGTSYFIAFLLKLLNFKVKFIYHEHYGKRASQSKVNNFILLFCLFFFNKILVVNNQLKDWFIKAGFKKVYFIPNFASLDNNLISVTKLLGEDEKRIVCLANLKNPKNHIFLIKAFHRSELIEKNWTVHLIGKNFNDPYFKEINNYIVLHNLQNAIYIYDSRLDIKNILSQSTIGVLCSTDEGFPVTLLEYGIAKIPVISTNVGFCPEIIIENQTGLLFDPKNIDEFVTKLKIMTSNIDLRNKLSLQLEQKVSTNFNKESILIELLKLYKHIYN